jgi:solute carrier family 25, member 38
MRLFAARLPTIPVVAEGGQVKSSSSALPKLGNVANLTTGAAARVAAGLVVNPVTVLKVRYESSHYAYNSLVGAARDILKREGPRGFFAGFGVTAVRDAPYAGLYVLIYEQGKAQLGKVTSGSGIATASGSAAINFASGVLAAVSATTMTNPFDAIKTRIQIAPNKYKNMVQAAKLMLRDEGVRSMFNGLSLRIGRKAVSSALTWTVYEEVIRRAERVLV